MNQIHALAVLQSPASWDDYGNRVVTVSYGPWVLLLALIVAILLMINLVSRLRTQSRRLDILHEALRNPSLSPQAQAEIVRQLKNPPQRRWLFSLGWLGLFAGIGWLCSEPHGREFTTAVVLTVSSFALITLPIALRELEARST